MRERHKEAEQQNARQVLRMCKIDRGVNFHTLTTSQVDSLLAEADRVKYRKPKAANGSRGRYFHDLMQRRAQ